MKETQTPRQAWMIKNARSSNPCIEVQGIVLKEKDGAFLLRVEGKDTWFPKSLILKYRLEEHVLKFVMSERVARMKGLGRARSFETVNRHMI
ncbi:MAG: hypothetical protein Q6370_016115 [Candidatus Sigynarchaeota archaeon]